MSGVRNLANAIANDPSFAAKAGMSKAEAAQFVSGSGGQSQKMGEGKKSTNHKAKGGFGKSSGGGY